MIEYRRHPLNQSRLYKVTTRRQLAEVLQISQSEMKALLSRGENYVRFTTDAGRAVQWPKPFLRQTQKRAAQLLARIETPEFLHSAKRGRSYITNARQHSALKPSVKVDIRNFFQSVRAAAVFHFFLDKMQCAPDVSAVLTKLMTVDGHLATGGNVSPILSYFTYTDMFLEIENLANQRDCKMTCLMDDITFTGPGATRELIYDVRRIVAKYRLRAHKTKLFRAGQAKVITGVAVTRTGLRVPNRRQVAIAEDLKSLSVAPSDEQRLTILRRVIGRMHEAAQLERFWRKRAHPLAAERKAIEQRLRLDLREVENGEPRAEQSQRSCGRQSGT
jgi:RNA-directed DNA polymerase